MSEVAVLEEPKTTVVPSPVAPLPKLVCSRDEATRHLFQQLKKGAEIKTLRIRTGQDLDSARAAKLEWTARTTEILSGIFDSPQVAEQCNDWVGRIYPEYAEFGNFVEQFYAEMDHRINRIKAAIKFVEKAPVSGHSPATPPATPAANVQSPVAGAAILPQRLSDTGGLLICSQVDPATRDSVAEFLESLDIELSVVEQMSDMSDALDRNRDIAFAVILTGESHDDQFALGFCAGRLGLNRVVLLNSQADVVLSDEPSALTQLALDIGGGWQLQLAKHLKRAGISVDLNRLC